MIDYDDWLLRGSEYSDRCPVCSALLDANGNCGNCDPEDWPEDDGDE